MRRSNVVTNLVLLLSFAAVSIGGLEYLAVNIGQPVPFASAYTVKAVFPDADGVPTAADVRVSGVVVGKVTAVDADPSSPGYTVVTLSIQNYSAVPVYSNGSATVRPKTLLGEKYVDLQVGGQSGEQIPSGGSLPIGAASKSVSNDEVFNSFDAPTRAQLQKVLQDLNTATVGKQGDIRAILPDLQKVAADLQPVAQVYAQDQPEVDHILVNLATILQTTADEEAQIADLLHNGGIALTAIAQRDAQLIGTLQEAATVAQQLNAAAAPTVVAQRQAISELAPSLTSVNGLLDQIVGPQTACGSRSCGIDQIITETFTGNVSYPSDQLNVTSANGQSVTSDWQSMFSMPADAEQSGGNTHSALNIVLSEHCDSVSTTLNQLIPNLSPAQQASIQALCQTAVGHSGSSLPATTSGATS